jgi:integrase
MKSEPYFSGSVLFPMIKAYPSIDRPDPPRLLLLGSQKDRSLCGKMSERAITKHVCALGEEIGLIGLSAHDCRHYWATQAARNATPLDRLQDAGDGPVKPCLQDTLKVLK